MGSCPPLSPPAPSSPPSPLSPAISILGEASSESAAGQAPGGSGGYEKPPWAGVPPADKFPYFLEVLKNGTIVEKIDLQNKDAFLVGRNADVCDVVLDHPSISRQHAVIQLKEDGEAFIYDMSTHGTRINKKQLKTQVYAKIGVGDVMQFGQSSRHLIFNGPEHLIKSVEGGWGYKKRPQEQAPSQPPPPRKPVAKLLPKLTEDGGPHALFKRQDEGASWGFGDDAEEEEEEETSDVIEEARQLKESGQLTEKQEQVLEKLEKKLLKISNIRDEIKKIKKKEDGGDELTAGQVNAIQRGEERIKKIEEDMVPMEENLSELLRQLKGISNPSKTKSSRHAKHSSDEEDLDSDDDEFYDRTKLKKKSLSNKEQPQNIKTLQERKVVVEKELKELKEEMSRAEKAEGDGAGEEEDSLDSYLHDMNKKQKAAERASKVRKIKELEAETVKIDKLVKILTPAISISAPLKAAASAFKFKSSTVTAPRPPSAAVPALSVDSSAKKVEEEKKSPAKAPAEAKEEKIPPPPPPPSHVKTAEAPPPHAPPSSGEEAAAMPTENGSGGKRKEAEQPQAQDPPAKKLRPQQQAEEPTKNPEVPSFVDFQRGGLYRAKTKEGDKKETQAVEMAEPPKSSMPEYVEEEDASWVPPMGQTGDGRTSLNEKFGY